MFEPALRGGKGLVGSAIIQATGSDRMVGRKGNCSNAIGIGGLSTRRSAGRGRFSLIEVLLPTGDKIGGICLPVHGE